MKSLHISANELPKDVTSIKITNSDVLYFFIYAVLGWFFETTYCVILDGEFVKRGFFYGPYLPVFGFGAIIVLKLVAPYCKTVISLFLVSIIGCTVLEYFTSIAIESIFHVQLWDYSKNFWNYQGRICLVNSLLFGIMAVAVMYLMHPTVSKVIRFFKHKTRTKLAIISVSIILFDLLISAIAYSQGAGNMASGLLSQVLH